MCLQNSAIRFMETKENYISSSIKQWHQITIFCKFKNRADIANLRMVVPIDLNVVGQ